MIKKTFICVVTLGALLTNHSAYSQFESNPLSQAIDAPNFDVINSDPGQNDGWNRTTMTSTKGGDSAMSRLTISEDIARMEIKLEDKYLGGRISFDWKISSVRRTDLVFSIESRTPDTEVVRDRIAGIRDWESVSFDIPPCGEDYTIAWSFSSAGNISKEVKSWVDNVVITESPTSPVCDVILTPVYPLLLE